MPLHRSTLATAYADFALAGGISCQRVSSSRSCSWWFAVYGFAFTRGMGSRRGGPYRPSQTVACAKCVVTALTRDCPARTPKDSTGGYDYQRLRFSGSHSAILALIQLFELWKSLTAFPGPTSSSRRARSSSASRISST